MPISVSQTNVAFSTIQTEYGGSNPIGLSEYYRGGSNVPNGPAPGTSNTTSGITAAVSSDSGTGGIPTSGAISVGNFRPSSKTVTITVTVAANVVNFDLLSAITARLGTVGNPINCTCTINAGVYVGSNSTSTPGFTTGSSWPAGSSLTIVNNGYIIGRGGAGGNGGGVSATGAAGGAGGTALNITLNTTINNLGYLYGGGGGGGGGGSATGSNYGAYSGGGGGGGGQSFTSSTRGTNGGYTLWPGYTLGSAAFDGTSGTLAGAGTGGGGAWQQESGEGATILSGGDGGNGGTWGTAGSAGASGINWTSNYSGGSAGAAGKYLTKNGFTVTWTNTGTRLGGET